MRDYRDEVEYNPARLEQVEDRLALIHSLQRKYGDSIAQVLAFALEARQELETIEHSGERIAELEAEQDHLLHEIGRLGLELSERSRRCMERMGIKTIGELVARTPEELLASRNFGRTSLAEVTEKLARLGLTLRQPEPEPEPEATEDQSEADSDA